jgi:hypothetical protein
MAPHRSEGPTDWLQFSTDAGACWNKVQLPEAMLVDNIRMDPSGAGHIFLVHGTACLRTPTHPSCSFEGGAAPPSKMFSVDIRDLMAGEWKASSFYLLKL